MNVRWNIHFGGDPKADNLLPILEVKKIDEPSGKEAVETGERVLELDPRTYSVDLSSTRHDTTETDFLVDSIWSRPREGCVPYRP